MSNEATKEKITNTHVINDSLLNKAADRLVAQLPGETEELMFALQKDHTLDMWKLVCGVIYHCYQTGELSAFELDPAWSDGFREKDLICEHCKEPFKAKRMGQRFCSTNCGLVFNKQMTEDRRLVLLGKVVITQDAKSNTRVINTTPDTIPVVNTSLPHAGGGWMEMDIPEEVR